jgi:hypothetical protein
MPEKFPRASNDGIDVGAQWNKVRKFPRSDRIDPDGGRIAFPSRTVHHGHGTAGQLRDPVEDLAN